MYSGKFIGYCVVYKSLYGLAPEYLRSKFTDCSDISSYSLGACRGKLNKSFSYSGARCCGIAYLSSCGSHKLSPALNLAVVVSLIIMHNLKRPDVLSMFK